MTADYEADVEFDKDDWLEFSISADVNSDQGKDVKLVFDIPDGVSVEYEGISDWEELDSGDVYDSDGFTLIQDGIVDNFRASFASPGAYEITVEFTTADTDEDVLFTLDMEMGRVALAEGPNGVAGNGVIYELPSGTAYKVTEIDGEKESVYYTTSDGALVDDMEDMEALDNGVTMITGLDNDMEYLVEVVTE